MNIDSTKTLHTGSTMPVMGLGTWKLTNDTAETIARAIKIGYPMIDTSSDYGTQEGVGNGIKKSGVKREDIYIVTKVEETDDSYVRTHSNLEELQTDFVDLMLIHRPPERGVGLDLWEGLIRAQSEGLTLDIGVSNYSVMQIEELIDKSGVVPTVNQIEWSPFGYSEEMRKYCKEREIIIQAYSPLTHGKRLDEDRLEEIAEKYGKTSAQLLIRWNLQMGTVPIAKANDIDHLEENLDVFDFEIALEDMIALRSLNEEYSSLGNLPYV
jgi:2,5-diketo-D-gluconate reductase A